MVYSDVIRNNFHKILNKKNKYTIRDVNTIFLESFFDKSLNNGNTFTLSQAKFIVICTAIFYNIPCSKKVYQQ